MKPPSSGRASSTRGSSAYIHQRSATTSDGAMIADIALSALGDGLTHTLLRHFGLD